MLLRRKLIELQVRLDAPGTFLLQKQWSDLSICRIQTVYADLAKAGERKGVTHEANADLSSRVGASIAKYGKAETRISRSPGRQVQAEAQSGQMLNLCRDDLI